MKKALLALVALATLPLAVAQVPSPAIEFTAKTTTGNGSVVPVLTWKTEPAAVSCTASGGWSGTKAASGTQTLPAIKSNRTYVLQCQWPGTNDKINLSWIPPTTNTDGTPLTDLKGYKVYYGTSSTMSTNTVKEINSPSATTTVLENLAAGTWYMVMSAVNTAGVESDKTAVVSKRLSGATDSKSIGIAVLPLPNPPTALKVE